MSASKNLILYHGTIGQFKDPILKYGYKLGTRKDQYLGNGVYFYDDTQHALQWALKKAKHLNDYPVVLCSSICLNDDDILDLTASSVSKHNSKTFERFYEMFKNDFVVKDSYTTKRKQVAALASLIINAYCRKHSLKLVKAALDVDEGMNLIEMGIIIKYEVQYSVRDCKIIKSTEIAYDGYRSNQYEIF